jgi:hypothetical protein
MRRFISLISLTFGILFSVASGTTTGNTYYAPAPNNNDAQICIAKCQAKYEICKEKKKVFTNWCAIDLESCIHLCE